MAHQPTIVAAHPDTPLPVLAETGYDVSRQAVCHGETVEAFAHGRDIPHSSIKRTYPQAALGIVGDGIYKPVVMFLPLSRLRVEAYQAFVTAYANASVSIFKQRVYMPARFGELRVKHLFQPAVAVHQQQPVFPCAQPVSFVSRLKHAERCGYPLEIEMNGLKLVVQPIELLYHWLSPVRDGPYLIAGIYKHLRHSIARSVDVIMFIVPRLGHVQPYPLLHRRYP